MPHPIFNPIIDVPAARTNKPAHQAFTPIVGIVECKGRVFVATAGGVFEFKDEALVPVPFALAEKPE